MEIDELEKIGLSKRESEVYIALLQKKEFTAAEVASITDVTRTKVYEILQNLEIKGLCTGTQKNHKKIYRAIDPPIAFQNVLSEYEKELEKKRVFADSLGKSLHNVFKTNSRQNNSLDYVELMTDKKQIAEKWIQLEQEAKESILIFDKAPYAVTPIENLSFENEIIKKEITYRFISEYKSITTKSEQERFVEMLSASISMGEELRLIDELPMKMAVVDSATTMLALKDPISLRPSITTIIITHPDFATTQRYVFESIWQKAITFDEYKAMIGI